MLDIVKMSYEEYANIHDNSLTIIENNSRNFDYIFKTDEISLPHFILNVEDKMLLENHYNKDTKTLKIKILTRNGNRQVAFTADDPRLDLTDEIGVVFHIKYDFKNEGDQMWWQAKCQESGQTPFSVAADLASQFFSINFYVKNVPEVVKSVSEKKEETYVEKKKGNKRYKSRVVLQKTIYIHAKKFNKSDVKHVVKCLCWGVRGHFRYMRNGKVVWVRPYRKGKERNNDMVYAGKEYAL